MTSPEAAAAPKNGADPAAKPAPESAPVAAESKSTTPPPTTAPADASAAAVTDDDGVNPLEFEGSVDSNHDLPTPETIRKIDNYVVLDRDGKSHTFRSLYTGKHTARRVLIIFVRHFYCGVRF
jgi:hypothetical protein